MGFRNFIFKYPNLTSLVSFILFFVVLIYFWHLQPILALTVSLSLAVHEYSHALAMKLLKIPVKAVLFIPFMGAVAIGGGINRLWTKKEECIIALAGPIGGFLTLAPVYLLAYLTSNILFYIAITYIVFINLLNLLPIGILDGGRVINSILKSLNNKKIAMVLWMLSISGSIFILWSIKAINFILIIALLMFPELIRDWKEYYNGVRFNHLLSRKQIALFLSIYISLVACPFIVSYLLS